jgi:hypothetical protein
MSIVRQGAHLNRDSPDDRAIRGLVTSFRLDSQGARPPMRTLVVSEPKIALPEAQKAGRLLIWAQFSRRGSSVR